MRDHRQPQTPEEAEAMERSLRDITEPMRRNSKRFEPTPNRAQRRAASKQQKASRKRNRS